MTTNRRLAAILAADVVGYSRLMGQDEAGTLQALKALRFEVLDPKVAEHNGRIFKTTGDGLLAEFPSVVNAVRCAVDIQRVASIRNANLPEGRAVQLRIGVNIGDVIVEGQDIFGDGVNIAARLEGIAPPGGVAISGTVKDHLGSRLDLQFEDTGEHQLKNIAQPMRVYRALVGATVPTKPAPALPDKPSIAVLPFQNMSGDPEQDYFADGIVEEIITALSRNRFMFVIARNSSFTYKGRAVDIKLVARELGVRYVLQGSVRKSGNRVRITGQLIDASIGAHLWADRFDGNLEDIFDLQDQVTASVVGAISPKLEQAEIERAKLKPTEILDAYDYYLRGLAGLYQWTRDSNTEALAHFYRAIEVDPNFAAAYGMAARCYLQRRSSGWTSDRNQENGEVERLARRARELGRDDAVALSAAGFALAYIVGDPVEGNSLIERALVLNPNYAWAWYFSGWAKLYLGEPATAIERASRAIRLSPQDIHIYNMQTVMGYAHLLEGRFKEALSWGEAALREKPDHVAAFRVIAASSYLAGWPDQARKAMARILELDPGLRISNLKDVIPFRRQEDLGLLADALGKAGLPE